MLPELSGRSQPSATDEGLDDLDAWVLGSDADEDVSTVSHMGQEGILLGLMPSMDLIHKRSGPLLLMCKQCPAASMASRGTLNPARTALRVTQALLERLAMMLVKVVLPISRGP